MTTTELQQEALSRATGYKTVRNYRPIIQGFADKGVPESDVKPRENVFTYRAWQALGRQVRKGEHGVKITTWLPMPEKKNDAGEVTRKAGTRPKGATVFHVSQTDPKA